MNHHQNREALAKRTQALLSSLNQLSKPPRPYQIEAFGRLHKWLCDPRGSRRGYFAHATGLGKTYLFSSILQFCTGLRCLVIVPTKVLLQQTARKIQQSTGGILGHLSSVSRVVGENDETIALRGHDHSDIVITTNDSFELHADQLALKFVPSLIIWDECHWAYTESAQKKLSFFPEAVIVGYTATPDYLGNAAKNGYVSVEMENGKILYGDPSRFARAHFGTMIDERTVRWGIENHWLSSLAYGRIEFDAKFDQIPLKEGEYGLDYDASALQKLMAKHWPVMCETVRRLYKNRQYDLRHKQCFAVCPGVEEAQMLAEVIGGLGIPSACITGRTPDRRRLKILEAYDQREINLISSVMVLREGWDAPGAEVGMILRPTTSRVVYVQIMGRVLRIDLSNPNKVALILDAHFQGGKLSPMSAPIIFGKDRFVTGGIICGPKEENDDEEEEDSPYLPKHAKPKLIFVDAMETEWAYRAGKDGFFEDGGRIWGTKEVIANMLEIASTTIDRKIIGFELTVKNGKDFRGKDRTFYDLAEVAAACGKTVTAINADSDGLITYENRSWGTKGPIAALLGISDASVRRGIKKHKPGSIIGKDRRGHVADFYKVDDVEAACKKLSVVTDRASENGLFCDDGHVWGTVHALKERIGHVTRKTIDTAIADAKAGTGLVSRKGRDRGGHIQSFYCLDQVEKAVANLRKKRKGNASA